MSNPTGIKMSSSSVIREYFGDVPIKELKDLSPEERQEIAELAAKELGWPKCEDNKWMKIYKIFTVFI